MAINILSLTLLALVFQANSQPLENPPCNSDDFCAKTFTSKYFCNKETKICQRKPLFSEISFLSLFGFLLLISFSALAGPTGLGFTGPSFVFLAFCLDFTLADSREILKIAGLLGLSANLLFALGRRKEEDKDRLHIDWPLAAFCLSLLLCGKGLGELAFDFLSPAWRLAAIFTVLMLLVLIAYKQNARNSAEQGLDRESGLSAQTWGRGTGAENDFFRSLTEVKRKGLGELLAENCVSIFFVFSSTILFFLAEIFKGKENTASDFLNKNKGLRIFSVCNFISIALYLIFCCFAGSQAYFSKQRLPRAFGPTFQAKLAAVSLVAGSLLSVAEGGTAVFGALLFGLGIEPLVIWATASLALFFSSAADVGQLLFIRGFDWNNGIFTGLLAFLGAFLGNFLLGRIIKKEKRLQEMTGFLILVILVVSAAFLPLAAVLEFLEDPNFFVFGSLC